MNKRKQKKRNKKNKKSISNNLLMSYLRASFEKPDNFTKDFLRYK